MLDWQLQYITKIRKQNSKLTINYPYSIYSYLVWYCQKHNINFSELKIGEKERLILKNKNFAKKEKIKYIKE